MSIESTNRVFDIEGMHCAGCVSGLEKAFKNTPGVTDASVSLTPQRARVALADDGLGNDQLLDVIKSRGYVGRLHEDSFNKKVAAERELWRRSRLELRKTWNITLIGILLCLPFLFQMGFMLTGNGMFLHPWLELLLATPVQFYVGWRFYKSALNALKHRQVNMDTLVVLGTTTAYVYSLLILLGWLGLHAGAGLYFEGAAVVITLVMLGKWLEERARLSTTGAVKDLVNLRPATALVVTSTGEEIVPVDELLPGDCVRVKPGETIAADGEVLQGQSEIDQSMLTGESVPETILPGARVTGGTTNISGSFLFRIDAIGDDTALAKILQLVEDAQSGKAQIQQLVDRISSVFVPAVILISLTTFVVWLMLGGSLDQAIAAAVAVIIIACPCALGLATPTALVTGMGLAAKNGILIRNIATVESSGLIKTIAFDKTGTLTEGNPIVANFRTLQDANDDDVLQLAASVQQYSEHPYAQALLEYANSKELVVVDASEFSNYPGLGVSAVVSGHRVHIGNQQLMHKVGIKFEVMGDATSPVTQSFIAVDDEVLAELSFTDRLRPEATEAISRLNSAGYRTVMLTGDNAAIASRVASQVGVQEFHASLRPEQKNSWIENHQQNDGAIAMVGDGINDAPALVAADVGIAIGTGTDVARQSAGIVLMQANLLRIADAFTIMQRTRSKLRQNLFWAFIYNVVAIPLAAFGMLSPALAGSAMALSSVSVVANSLLLKRWKPTDQKSSYH
ncbi:MAG: Cu+-exporting ATPase [Parasphingorhabdus sp.]|jgi:Cu+-exporting ATPase